MASVALDVEYLRYKNDNAYEAERGLVSTNESLISSKTLAVMDSSIYNLKNGKVSEPIDLTVF